MKSEQRSVLGESLHSARLENGLRVTVFPKPSFSKTYAFFAVNYGGMDTRFRDAAGAQESPTGVAHFLEHKMFDMPGGNALQELTLLGASPNAFTGSDMTAYHFETTENVSACLELLLDFVTQGYFVQESVEKEQGIIGEEIRMMEDTPSWQAYLSLMDALYHSHPVRHSVAGTRETIAGITSETLSRCHRAFYHPDNMTLCVAGPVEPEAVFSAAARLSPDGQGQYVRDYGRDEPPTVRQRQSRRGMAVSRPLFQLGVKLPPAPAGEARHRQRLLGDLVWEALMGTSSPLYARLYQAGLLDATFYGGYEDFPGGALLLSGGESRDPQAVRQAVLDEAARLQREGVDPKLFARLSRAAYGAQVRAMNSFESLCIRQARAVFAGEDAWNFPALYESFTAEEATALLRDWLREDRLSLVEIVPQEREA